MTPTTGPAPRLPSIEELDQQARAPGSEAAAWLRFGWALYAAGSYLQAAEAARECRTRSASDPEPSYLMGMALKAAGDGEAAVAAFKAAAAVLPAMQEAVRGAMLRRLAVGQVNWIERGKWDLEPETWIRT